MEIRVKIIPGSRKDHIEESSDGRLIVSVRAPRKEGKANDRLRELLAIHFDVPLTRVHILKGHASSSKTVRIIHPSSPLS